MATTRTFDDNLRHGERAQLARFADGPLLHLIDGEPTPSASGDTFDNHSPIDGALLGDGGRRRRRRHRRRGDAAAADAFGDWSGRSGQERKRILHDVADLIVERADEIAAVECVDTGQTDPVHERGRDPRRRELPVLRRPRTRRAQRALDARRAPRQLLQPRRRSVRSG